MTNPYGGKVEYSYRPNAPQFYNLNLPAQQNTPVIYQKKITAGGPSATWTYTFTPASALFTSNTNDSGMDKTVVQGPNGSVEYYHFGYRSAQNGTVWAVGTLRKKRYLDAVGMLKRTELYEYSTFDWVVGKNILPHDWAVNGKYDQSKYVAQLSKRTISTSSSDAAVVSYSDFFGPQLPRKVLETGPGNSRETSIRYAAEVYPSFIDGWLRTPVYKTEVISDSKGLTGRNKVVLQEFYSDPMRASFGQPKTRQEYGVVTKFEYDNKGNLYKKTDPANFSTTYENYKRGIPQLISMQESVSLISAVDGFGRVESTTDGENHKTSYQYEDYSNHLTSINLPTNNDVSVQWTWQYGAQYGTKVVKRGTLEVTTHFDGFARPTLVDARDTVTGKHIYVRSAYDGEGNKRSVKPCQRACCRRAAAS